MNQGCQMWEQNSSDKQQIGQIKSGTLQNEISVHFGQN